jgi:predicted RNase H-like HicB family nuclease
VEEVSVKKATYFAVFERGENGQYSAYFPDLPGCVTTGDTYAEVLRNASDAMGFHLWGMGQDGEALPAPSEPPFPECEPGDIVCRITAYPDLVAEDMRNQAVRVNVSIPAWMRTAAEAASLNYSKILQAAISERLGLG